MAVMMVMEMRAVTMTMTMIDCVCYRNTTGKLFYNQNNQSQNPSFGSESLLLLLFAYRLGHALIQ